VGVRSCPFAVCFDDHSGESIYSLHKAALDNRNFGVTNPEVLQLLIHNLASGDYFLLFYLAKFLHVRNNLFTLHFSDLDDLCICGALPATHDRVGGPGVHYHIPRCIF
jgi:hypothetical protein